MSRKKKAKVEHFAGPQGDVKQYAADLVAAGAEEVEVTLPEAHPPDIMEALRPVAQAVESASQTIRELSAAGSLPAPPPVPAWTPASAPFKLMKESAHWWSLQDYGAVLGAMAAIRPASVLEFGPGSSTLALIEGGATSIDTCEDAPDWAEVYEERIVKRFPEIVRLHRFEWPAGRAISIPSLEGKKFDLCLIDGPRETARRPDVVRFALSRSTWVLVPVEEHETRAVLRPIVAEIAREACRSVTFTTTGPLAGAFALIGPAAG